MHGLGFAHLKDGDFGAARKLLTQALGLASEIYKRDSEAVFTIYTQVCGVGVSAWAGDVLRLPHWNA